MAKDVYLIGGPAAGRIVRIPDAQKAVTVQWVKSNSGTESEYAESRYAPKGKSDFESNEFHWLGDE